jgi:hypothetical protein
MLAAFLATGALSTTAFAQDYTTNTIAGSVQDLDGNVVSGATIEISSAKGVRRSATVGADGSFRFPRLPLGEYSASVTASGYESLTDLQISNQLGVSGLLTITIAPEGATIEEIVTTGVRQASVDFNSNETGITVNVGELMTKYPVARDVTSVALFAPGAQAGDTDFNSRSDGSLASFSGASVAENAYYINGMNVTNFRTFTGASTIPFEFYDQIEVKTGGYQAEFGRSMGAFINSASKSGSNDFIFEVTGYWEPEGLRETRRDIETTWNSLDYDKSTDLILQASGPIIEDRLFFYGLYNDRDVYEQDYSSSRRVDTFDDEPFYAAKIDLVPFDGHRLEYTYFTDARKIRQRTYAFNDDELERSEVNGSEVGEVVGDGFVLAGGTNEIFKYTGVFTDWFTISAMYGTNEFERTSQSTADGNPVIFERMTNPSSSTTIGAWANTFASEGRDEREAIRVDADFYFEALGDHHIRVGFDQEDLKSQELSSLSGGEYWRYHYCTDEDGCFLTSSNPVAFEEEYVRHLIIDQGGEFEIEQSAWYIQDSWEVSDRLTVNLGIRSEVFKNLNGEGEVFIETDDEIAPRLGATYDLFGDGRTLLSGFFGRYYMPVAANTNIRMSGAELFIEEYLRHNGFDERQSGTDAPTGVDYANPIQYNLVSDGTVPSVATIKAEQVDPLFSDEYMIAIEHAFDNEWVVGARYTYRELTTQIDDIGINPATVAWALDNGYDLDDVYWIMDPSEHSIDYVLANPGENIRVATDLLTEDGSLVYMDLTAEMLGYPKPKRKYNSIELTAEKDTDTWGIYASYVWAQSEGNTEGMVKSDIGQADPGLTQDFDLVGVMLNADGPLPIQAEHQLKVSGYYVLSDQLRFGANARIRSPRKFGCFGVLPDGVFGVGADAFDDDNNFTGNLTALRQVYESQYDDDYWFCDGEPVKRGSAMEADWTYTVDLNAMWVPQIDSLPGELSFRVDIFNVFNDESVTDRFEQGETLSGALETYGKASAYNPPRSVRLSANWKFF